MSSALCTKNTGYPIREIYLPQCYFLSFDDVVFNKLYEFAEHLVEELDMLHNVPEYRADAFAADHGHGETLISGLKKLASHGLSNLTPHPLVVWFSYSHPTLAQRIRAIREQPKLDI